NPQISDQPRVNSQKKLKQIGGPRSIGRDAIRPANGRIIREALSVAQMVLRDSMRIGNGLLLAEHQQPGDRQSFLSAAAIPSPAAEHLQKAPVILVEPRMSGGARGKTVAVLLQTLLA